MNKSKNTEIEKFSGFDIILLGLNSNLFLRGKSDEIFYSRKFLKLFFIGISLIILSFLVIYIVFDVGYNTSTFKNIEVRTLTERFQESDLGNSAKLQPQANKNALGDQTSETVGVIMDFFTKRKNSIIIYSGMIILLFSFIITTFKRMKFLWTSFIDQYTMNKQIVFADHKRFDLFKDGKYQTHVGSGFIDRIYKSFSMEGTKEYFHQIYTDIKDAEESRSYLFEDSVTKNAVWIIRLGIFGTLLGVTIAFFELWFAMGSFEPGEQITKEFLKLVQNALLGNAVAVATSLTAHGATLLIEVGITFFLKKENNLGWLNNTYQEFLQYPGFTTSLSATENNIGSLNLHITKVNETLNLFSGKIHDLFPDIGELSEKFANLKLSFSNIDKKMSNLDSHLNQYEKFVSKSSNRYKTIDSNVSELSKATEIMVDHVGLLDDNIKKITTETNNFRMLINGLINSIINIGKDSMTSMQNNWKSINKRVGNN